MYEREELDQIRNDLVLICAMMGALSDAVKWAVCVSDPRIAGPTTELAHMVGLGAKQLQERLKSETPSRAEAHVEPRP